MNMAELPLQIFGTYSRAKDALKMIVIYSRTSSLRLWIICGLRPSGPAAFVGPNLDMAHLMRFLLMKRSLLSVLRLLKKVATLCSGSLSAFGSLSWLPGQWVSAIILRVLSGPASGFSSLSRPKTLLSLC